jgi:hypothetical protein
MKGIHKFIPLGSLDQDTDPLLMDPKNYSSALNTRPITQNTESTGATINIRGNEFRFDIPPVECSNSSFRIYIDNSPGTERQLTLYGSNGYPLVIAEYTDNATADLTRTEIVGLFNYSGISFTALVDNYFDMTVIGGYVNNLDVFVPVCGVERNLKSTGENPVEILRLSESIPDSLTGPLYPIGSYDLLGDLFIWSTTQREYPTVIPQTIISSAASATNNIIIETSADVDLETGDEIIISGSESSAVIVPTIISIASTFALVSYGTDLMRVTTSAPHGLPIGAYIRISIAGALAASGANGTWTAIPSGGSTIDLLNSTFAATSATGSVTKYSGSDGRWSVLKIDTTHFQLLGSIFVLASTAGNITTNIQGLGQIGVATYDVNSDAWTYVDLITSKEFNLITKKQLKTYCQKTNLTNNLYWVDDYNIPRVLYYRGAYIQNGAINYINPENTYSYGTIGEETKLFIGNTNVTLDFFAQLQVGGQLKAGNWRYAVRFLTENLNSTEWTDLSNPINVYFDPIGLVDADQLSGDESDTTTPKINQLEVTNIIPGIFSFIELAAVNYVDTAIIGYVVRREQLGDTQTEIVLNHTGSETGTTSLDLGTLNTRQIPYVTAQNIDAIDNRLILSNLTSRDISDLSDWAATFEHSIKQGEVDGTLIATGASYRLGEFFDPENLFRKIGYMHNEVYRFGVKGRFRGTGEFSPVFWIDDIKIDTDATNISTPNRRVAGLPDWNLTSATTGDTVYQPYVEFSNIDLDFQVNGVAIRDLFEELIFERVECVPEIISNGNAALSISGTTTEGWHAEIGTSGLMAYPYISGLISSGVPAGTPSYPGGATAYESIIKLYSPDFFCGTPIPSFNVGDEIINFGNPQRSSAEPANVFNTPVRAYYSSIVEYNGYFGAITPTIHLIENYELAGTGQLSLAINAGTYSQVMGATPTPNTWINKIGFLFECDTPLTDVAGINAYGFYRIQVRRPTTYVASDPDSSKYGDRVSNRYIPTGASYRIEDNSPPFIPTGVISVYGGDTMTQKFFLKNRAPDVTTEGGSGGLGFYSQNRTNCQMLRKYADQPENAWTYPRTSAEAWLDEDNLGTDLAIYNQGYTPRNGINSDSAFDTSIAEQTDFRTRIIYSEIKPANAFADMFRVFLPLNFEDLDPTFGKITHHANGNGELYTWQQRSFERQFFNQRGTLEVSDGSQVLIGNGSVFGQAGETLSVVGCRHVWGVVKGKSASGNDVFYWINTELNKFMRFAADGTSSVADIKGMQSFFANNLRWVNNQDTPADNYGIHGVWNDRYAEALFTVRGQKPDVSSWNVFASYSAGAVVQYPVVEVEGFGVPGEFYRRTANGNSVPTSLNGWELISRSDPDYFNEYTIVLNEFKGAFTAFYTPTPKIYLRWAGTYLSPRPYLNDDTMKIYQHDIGDYCSWYDDGTTVQEQDGHIEAVIAAVPDNVKWWEALRVDTEISPFRFDFKNRTQESFLTAGEIEEEEGYYQSSIKEDSTVTATNDGDTSLLYSKWLKVKMTFEKLVYQRLTSLIIKFRPSVRLANK